MRDQRLPESVDAAVAMLSPPQQRLPEKIAGWLEKGVEAFAAGDEQGARTALQHAVAAAEQLGYL